MNQKSEAVQDRLLLLEDILSNTAVPTAVYITDDLMIEYANEAMTEIWNLDHYVQGKKLCEVFTGTQNYKLLDHAVRVMKNGIPVYANDIKVDSQLDNKWITKYYNYSFLPLYNSNKILYGVLNTCTESTNLHNAQKQLVSFDERLKMAIEACGMGTYEIDIATSKIKTSGNFNNIWSTENEIVIDSLLGKMHPDDAKLREKAHKDSIASGMICYETRIFQDNNDVKWIKVFGKIIKDNAGRPMTIVGIIQDIHKQKEFEVELKKKVEERTMELSRSNDDLLHFANVVSHDLQEPVRKIKIFSDLIKNEAGSLFSERSLKHFERIEKSSHRMQSLIAGILSYSTVDKNNQSVHNINLNELINNIKTDLELIIMEKGAILVVNDLPTIQGTPVLIHQLFYNLIQNALKFTKADVPPRMIISASITDKDGVESVMISFKDNGIGVDPAFSEKIFNTFERLHSKDQFEGNGIGLALCRKIVKRHNGRIIEKSEKDQGAEFIVTLPLKQNTENL